MIAAIAILLVAAALYAARPRGPTLYDRCHPFDLLARLAMVVKEPEVEMLRARLELAEKRLAGEQKVNAALLDRLATVEEFAGIPTTREKLRKIGIER